MSKYTPEPQSVSIPAPWSEENELAVIGGVFLSPARVLPEVRGDVGLTADDFYLERNQIIFRAMCDISDDGASADIDIRTVQAKLEESGKLDFVGGIAYLAAADSSIPDIGRASIYARVVRENSLKRSMITLLESFQISVYSTEFTVSLERLQARLADLAEGIPLAKGEGLVDVRDLDILEPDPTLRKKGIMVGLPDLDNCTRGWARGEFGILAARPGVGKSSIALAMLARACDSGYNCALFSLEMSVNQCFDRIIGSLAGIPQDDIQGLTLTGEQHVSWEEWRQHIEQNWSLAVDEGSGVSVSHIEAGIRRRVRKSEKPIDFFVVDYVQIMEHDDDRSTNRYLQIGKTTKRLKNLAKELDVAILLVAQVGRPRGGNDQQRPSLHELRESGNLEADASQVIAIYREPQWVIEDYETPEVVKVVAEMHVLKNRYGRTGVIPLYFDPSMMRVDCLSHEDIREWSDWRKTQ